jgi:hypothetical protein
MSNPCLEKSAIILEKGLESAIILEKVLFAQKSLCEQISDSS